jgi:Zn-dependent protease with chaperone function
MALAFCLLVYAAAVMTLAPPVLIGLTRTGRAPRAAITTWVAALLSTLVALLAAPVALTADLLTARGDLVAVSRTCLAVLRSVGGGSYAPVVQVSAVVVAGTATAYISWSLGRGLWVTRRRTLTHADAVRLVGRPNTHLGTLVLDSPHRLAYCLPGRDRTVVVTTATVTALTTDQLDAVLAHEHAHLDQHHHLLLAIVRGLARVFPGAPLFHAAAAQLSHLVEFSADDAAARRHGGRTVTEALLAMTGTHPVPAGALAAAAAGVRLRVHRLLGVPAPLRQAWLQLTLATTATALLAAPVAAIVVVAHGVSLCSLPTV